ARRPRPRREDRRAGVARRRLRGDLHRAASDAGADRGHRGSGRRGRHRALGALRGPQLSLPAGARAARGAGRGRYRRLRRRDHSARGHRRAEGHGRQGALHARHVDPGHRPLRPRAHPRRGLTHMMTDVDLTPEQQQVRDVARQFAEAELGDKIAPFDERHEFPHAIVAKLGPLGFLGVVVPEEFGGAGLDYVSYALIVEELCRGDASVGITMWAHNSLCTGHIASFGSPEHKQRYPPPLAPGQVLGAWGLPEPGSGSDAAALVTRAELRGGEWVLNGSKAFITNASVASTAVVMARTDGGRSPGTWAFLAERGAPGFTSGKPYRKLGLHASDTAELIFQDARIPAANLLGERGAGFVQAMTVLEGGRIAMAAMGVGIAQAAVDQAVSYMRQRTAFGKALADFNGLQGMIADLVTDVEVARLLTLRAAYLKDNGRPAMHAAAM